MDPRIEDISAVGKSRYERGIPPGFKDATKSNSDPYGDLVGWFQIIAHANQNERPVILITNDGRSDDWFEKQGNELLGPRKELVKEMRVEAGVDFHIYRTSRFLEYAKQHVSNGISDETIEEVKRLQRSIDWRRLSRRDARNLLSTAMESLESSDLTPQEKRRQWKEIRNSEIWQVMMTARRNYYEAPRSFTEAEWRRLREDEIAPDYAYDRGDEVDMNKDWSIDDEDHES